MFKEAIHIYLTQTEQGAYRKAAAFYHRAENNRDPGSSQFTAGYRNELELP
ncbi:MAG: hypothetical protein OEZ30_10005 [Candidatus Aminicenantes bacterium]|nr:hypothetical protein [Candidatus Aminicenantes bacterium]